MTEITDLKGRRSLWPAASPTQRYLSIVRQGHQGAGPLDEANSDIVSSSDQDCKDRQETRSIQFVRGDWAC
jgi:hypothetical protein